MKRREEPLSAGICIQNKQRVEAALALIIKNASCPIIGHAVLIMECYMCQRLCHRNRNCSNSGILLSFSDSA